MTQLSFFLETNAPTHNIEVEVKLDQQLIFFGPVQEKTKISCNIDDAIETAHELSITMLGKTVQDTSIDTNGNIVKDVVVLASEFNFDEINIDQLCYQHALYQHNYNGSGANVQKQFYGTMGCNGTVTFKFSSPVYVWLLENMWP